MSLAAKMSYIGASPIRAFSSMDNLAEKDKKIFEELTKQVDKLKTDLEAEKQKLRQVHRDKVLELKAKQDEFDKKLERTLELQSKKRETDKQADLKALEEKVKKQKEREIKNIWRLKEDEIKRLKKQFTREKEDAVKDTVEIERRKSTEKVHEGEDILHAKITQLTKDIFALNEQNTKLEEQAKLLTQENYDKIEIMRRMKKEHESKVEALVRQYKSDALRESAKLKLAERRIQEKEHHLSLIEHKVDMATLEREAVSEELTRIKKSIKDTPPAPHRPPTPDLTNDRITPPSPSVYNPLQNRINDLQAHCKKLEEQLLNLKQDNAQLRRKLSRDGGDGSDINTNKEVDEKMKRLRKRNAELVSLAKQLDDRCKALKMENEQLQSGSVSEDSKSNQQALRRQFARQQAKDLAEHTKQLHTRDIELEALRQQLSKLQEKVKQAEASNNSGVISEALSAVLSTVMMENLRLEKLLAVCYQKSQQAREVPLDPIEGFQAAAGHMRQLEEENATLHARVKELTAATSTVAINETDKGDSVLQEQLVQLQQAKEESDRSARHLERQLQNVRQESSTLRTGFLKLTSQHETSMMELQEQCDHLIKDLDVEKADSAKQRALVEQLREQYETLKKELPDSSSHVVSAEDMERFTREVEQLKEENKRILGCSDDLSNQLSTAKRQYVEAQQAIESKEQFIEKLRDELESKVKENISAVEEVDRIKAALAAALQEKEDILKISENKVTHQQEETMLEEHMVSPIKEKPDTLKASDEEKDSIKLEQQVKQESSQQGIELHVTNKPPPETETPEKVTSKPVPHRASSNIPIGKKSSAQKQMLAYPKHASPPKHISPKPISNLQSEFQQAGYEIEDGFDSEGDLNTFSEVVEPRKEEAEGMSTTSLEDSLLGSESFVSLDNYTKEVGGPKPKGSRVSSAREKERRHSQESETQSKERKRSHENEAELKVRKRSEENEIQSKQPQKASASLPISLQEESLQQPSVDLATEISQASETGQLIATTDSRPLLTTSNEVVDDAIKEKESAVGDSSAVKEPAISSTAVKLNETRNTVTTAEDEENSSESDSSDDDDVVIKGTAVSSTTQPVTLFVVKFDYNPSEMSPNPNPHQELALTAGHYVYIYGNMDEDGFYKGQTVDGKLAGLVPSNFVERVNEGELARKRQRSSPAGRRGVLQHIDEEEEFDPASDKSTTVAAQLLPPENVQLVKQSIDPLTQSVMMTVKWDPVDDKSSSGIVGYAVYMDDELYCSVSGAETGQADISGFVPKKTCTITVRSCTADGKESHDQPHPLTARGNLLVAPQQVEISASSLSPSVVVAWSYPSQTMEALYTPPTHFIVLIDAVECCRIEAKSDAKGGPMLPMVVEVSQDDITECGIELSTERDHHLIVRSLAANLQSEDSETVTISPDLVSHLMNASITNSLMSSIVRKDTSLSPVDNSTVSAPPVAKPQGAFLSSPLEDSSSDEEDSSSESDDVEIFSPVNRSIRENSLSPVITRGLTNGSVIGNADRQSRYGNDQVDGVASSRQGTKYYRALYSYNPLMMSPNEGLEEQELCFHEGDIIKSLGDTDSDGFMEGEIAGKKGLVPSNMIEEIADREYLQSLVVDSVNNNTSANHLKILNGCMAKMVRARYSYNPGVDSPNVNDANEELCFVSGDIISVCGEVGDDGFFLGELNGKRGMVPSNFVERIAEDDSVDGKKEVEVFAASEDDVRKASQIIKEKVEQKPLSKSTAQQKAPEKKRNLLSKGKGLISRVKKK